MNWFIRQFYPAYEARAASKKWLHPLTLIAFVGLGVILSVAARQRVIQLQSAQADITSSENELPGGDHQLSVFVQYPAVDPSFDGAAVREISDVAQIALDASTIGVTAADGPATAPSPASSVVAAAEPAPASIPTTNPAPDMGRHGLAEYLRLLTMPAGDRESIVAKDREREAQSWANLLDFLRVYSPNRFTLVTKLNPQASAPLRMRLLQRWANLQQTQITQPQLYELHVQQFRQEDTLLGLVALYRQAVNRYQQGRADALRNRITEETGKLIDLNLAEREQRIKTLNEALDNEKRTLAADRSNRDAIARDRSAQILSRTQRALTVDNSAKLPK